MQHRSHTSFFNKTVPSDTSTFDGTVFVSLQITNCVSTFQSQGTDFYKDFSILLWEGTSFYHTNFHFLWKCRIWILKSETDSWSLLLIFLCTAVFNFGCVQTKKNTGIYSNFVDMMSKMTKVEMEKKLTEQPCLYGQGLNCPNVSVNIYLKLEAP